MVDININLRLTLLNHPDVLLFPILVTAGPTVRTLAEHLVYELFPMLVAPRASQAAEMLLEHAKPDLRSATPDLTKDIQIDTIDAESFAQLFEDFGSFCDDITSHLDDYVGKSSEPQKLLTSLFRVLRWFCVRSPTVLPAVVDKIWRLFVALGKSEWRGGCNLCESFRCIVALPREPRISLLRQNVQDLAAVLFPLDFGSEVRLNATIFLDILTYTAAHLPGMRDVPAFRATFRDFWMVPICDEGQSWLVSKLADLAATPQIPAAILSLVDVLDEDCLPVTMLPVVLDGVTRGPAVLPLFRTAMMLCEMAFAESPVLDLILEMCGAALFETLGGLIIDDSEAAEVCTAAVPSLCALFGSPLAKPYRSQLKSF
jgi:hypothetical protein